MRKSNHPELKPVRDYIRKIGKSVQYTDLIYWTKEPYVRLKTWYRPFSQEQVYRLYELPQVKRVINGSNKSRAVTVQVRTQTMNNRKIERMNKAWEEAQELNKQYPWLVPIQGTYYVEFRVEPKFALDVPKEFLVRELESIKPIVLIRTEKRKLWSNNEELLKLL
jgi:hypothetical protein